MFVFLQSKKIRKVQYQDYISSLGLATPVDVVIKACLGTFGSKTADGILKTINCRNERYLNISPRSFTGKEKDSETGFGYFGARYYDSELLTGWLSVDPMSDKYPSLSSYNYCAGNPVKLVDPDGRGFDPTTEEKYIKKYEAELSRRIEYFSSIRDRELTAAEQSQLNECVVAKEEIAKLREDEDVIYSVNVSKKMLNNIGREGFVSYGGEKEGNTIININILTFCKLDDIEGYIGVLAHELGHAFQYYTGELALIKTAEGKWTSNDTKKMERVCHAREDMFEKGRINCNYMVNAQDYKLPDCYNNHWEDDQAMQVILYYQKNGGTIYRHK